MKKLIERIYKHPKTTVSGVLILGAVALYWFNVITTEQFLTGTTFLVGVGLIVSRDANKTQ